MAGAVSAPSGLSGDSRIEGRGPRPSEDGRGAAATPSPEVRRPARRPSTVGGLSRRLWYPSAVPFTMGSVPAPSERKLPHMDKLAELSHGAKVVLGAAIALLVVSFFNWFQYAGIGFANMWNGIGVLAGLLLIALIVWQALRLVNINVEIGVTPSMITAALSVLLLIFVAIRWLDKPGPSIANEGVSRTFWAWLGIILAIVIVVGAWMNMQAAGEGLADIRSQVGSAASAAKGTVDRDDKPAETAPAAPAPAEPAPVEPSAPPSDPPPTPETPRTDPT